MSHFMPRGAGPNIGFTAGALSARTGVDIESVKALLSDLVVNDMLDLTIEARDPDTGVLVQTFSANAIPDAVFLRTEHGVKSIQKRDFIVGYRKTNAAA